MPDDIRKAGAGDQAGPEREQPPKDRPSGDGKPEDANSQDSKGSGEPGGQDGKQEGKQEPSAAKGAKAGDDAGPGKDKAGDGAKDGAEGDDAKGGKDGKKGPLKNPLKKDKGGENNPIAKMKKMLKRIKMLIQRALQALKAFIFLKLFMMMKMLMMMLMNMLMAMVQAIVAMVSAIINGIMTALGVAAAVAATILTGGLFLIAAAVVAVVVLVTSDDAAQRSDMLVDCNTDASYMDVVEGIPVQAWTNAKIIYTFFKSYGEAAGVGHEYSDMMVAGILGNWYHESGIDQTSVETVFDEKYGIGPKKKWLQDGYVKTSYTEIAHMSMDGGAHPGDPPTDCPRYSYKEYSGTLVTPLLDDQATTCTVFAGEGVTYPETFVDGGYIGAVTWSEGPCELHRPAVYTGGTLGTIGYSYGTDVDKISGPIRFNVKLIRGVYQPTADGSVYWTKYPAIKRLGIGLGQWTDTGLDESGEPVGRAKDLLDYAEKHSNDWYHVDLQLMFALSDDGRANWLQCWNDMAFQSEWQPQFVSSTGTTYTNSWVDDSGETHLMPETARVAWCAESFARNWEGAPSNHSSLPSRIKNALMWYEIISQWNENYDYTMGTGNSLWTVAAATGGSEGSLWSMVAGEGDVGLDISKASRLRSCADLKFFGNSTLAEAAVSYAWGPGMPSTNNGTKCWQHLFTTMKRGDQYLRCCDRTVALAVHWTGTDSNLPWGSTLNQIQYLDERATAYKTLITSGGTLASDVAWWEEIKTEWTGDVDEYIKQLRPGDILIRNDGHKVPEGYTNQGVGHVVMFVGEDTISRRWPELITNDNGGHHGYCIVSGSINTKSPHVQKFMYAADGSSALQSYTVYRNRGTFCSEGDKKFINLSCVGHSNSE